MCEAISCGNINQIGWNAWASMIDQARELVLDVVNDIKVNPRNSSIVANGLDQDISQKKTDLDKYKTNVALDHKMMMKTLDLIQFTWQRLKNLKSARLITIQE